MKPFFLYGLAILLTKGFSLVSIPLVAHFLRPDEFGDLDVATSLVEFTGLLAALGLADTLYRFAPSEGKPAIAGIAGTALGSAACLLIAGFLAAPALHDMLGLAMPVSALRTGLAAAAIGGLIELPLAWLRWIGRPMAFLGFAAIRSIAQIGLVWLFLAQGAGPGGIFLATLCVHAIAALILTAMIWRDCGIVFSLKAIRRLLAYGMPLTVSALALFALGSLDRWFLSSAVSREAIGHYAIALKFALAASLAVQPLTLWWLPKRLAVLGEPGGAAANARVWKAGVTIMLMSGAAACLAMPVFFALALPPGYAPALAYLPALAGLVVLNEITGLSNAGAYLGRTGLPVLTVNAIAALVALCGYWILVPARGIEGAILATYAAQGWRFTAFVLLSRKAAPVPVLSAAPWLTAVAAVFPVAFAYWEGVPDPVAALPMLLMSAALACAVALATGMIVIPRTVFHARPA